MRGYSIIVGAMAAGLVLAEVVPGASSEVPKGWFLTGSNRVDYVVSVDHTNGYTGAASGLLASRRANPPGFGAIIQGARADDYRGKRVRLFAGVKTEGVTDWAGLWLRVNGVDGRILAFDNMQWPQSRRLQGDRAWNAQSLVLDVPQAAAALAYGVVLSGSGKVWMDGVRIEVVGPDVPVTQTSGSSPAIYNDSLVNVNLPAPANLDFED